MPRGRTKGSKNKKKILQRPYIAEITENSFGVQQFPETTNVPLIKSFLKVMGRTCVAEGQTIQEAITNLKPQVARGMGILTLEKGKVKKERILLPNMVMRLFRKDIGRLNKEVALKQVIGLFDASLF